MRAEIPTPNEIFTLLLCSMRYALPRQTYITGEIAQLIKQHSSWLTPAQLNLIVQELAKDLESNRISGLDRKLWELLLEELRKKQGSISKIQMVEAPATI